MANMAHESQMKADATDVLGRPWSPVNVRPPVSIDAAAQRQIRPYVEVWSDGSVRPNPGERAEVEGGFAGCAFAFRNAVNPDRPVGLCFPLRWTNDVPSAELRGIEQALVCLVALYNAQAASGALANAEFTVWTDCREALAEIRAAIGGPPFNLAPTLRGKAQVSHPVIINGIVNSIAYLQSRGIVARVLWQKRLSTREAEAADEGARFAADARKRFCAQSPSTLRLP
ncbi:hypothetical protein AC579_9143 [Pseudocercospora musae]|uniref:RNase H type-1 domain-containing protein n=1 Tax=Pseudocercospora musae TaxID=113226 RepID=A0A139IIL8_9PEZI|nr:hypothetical protein AC579_9143 [Pseudocercospora musae]